MGINNSRRHSIFDFIVCVILSAIYARIAWVTKIEINIVFVIRLVLVLWFTFVLIRGVRLLQYSASVDIDLRNYFNTSSSLKNNLELNYRYRFKEWKKFIKIPFIKSLTILILLLIVRIARLFINIPIAIYLDVMILLLLIYSAVLCLLIAEVIANFIADLPVKYGLNNIDVKYDKREMLNSLKFGLLGGIIFEVFLIYCFEMPKLHYVLFFIAITMLIVLSKILLNLYKLFSNAVYLILGIRFEKITLIRKLNL